MRVTESPYEVLDLSAHNTVIQRDLLVELVKVVRNKNAPEPVSDPENQRNSAIAADLAAKNLDLDASLVDGLLKHRRKENPTGQFLDNGTKTFNLLGNLSLTSRENSFYVTSPARRILILMIQRSPQSHRYNYTFHPAPPSPSFVIPLPFSAHFHAPPLFPLLLCFHSCQTSTVHVCILDGLPITSVPLILHLVSV